MSEKYCGRIMKKMSIEELENIYGARQEVGTQGLTDVLTKTTKLLTTSATTKVCVSAASVSAISGIVSYTMDCLG